MVYSLRFTGDYFYGLLTVINTIITKNIRLQSYHLETVNRKLETVNCKP